MSKNTTRSPAEMMMHGRRYAEGGSTSDNSMPDNIPHYKSGGMSALKGGGRPKSYMKNGRSCHAEGDSVLPTDRGVNPITGHKYGTGDAPYSESVKETKLRKGGRARRRHAEGDTVSRTEAVPFRKGGRTRRGHHSFGDVVKKIGGFASNVAPFLSLLLKEGGSANDDAQKLAMGGAGKVRKGIMTNKGRLI